MDRSVSPARKFIAFTIAAARRGGSHMIVVAADATMRPEVMAEVGNALAL